MKSLTTYNSVSLFSLQCDSGWFDYESCVKLTVGALYHLIPTPSPSASPTLTEDCFERVFHMSSQLVFTCTNDGIYPAEWDSPRKSRNYLFATSFECCEQRFPGLACNVVDVCIKTDDPTAVPSYAPTPNPSKKSLRPSKSPTPRPTRDPASSPIPTDSPVSYEVSDECFYDWHLSLDDENTCINGKFPFDIVPLDSVMDTASRKTLLTRFQTTTYGKFGSNRV
jgi:hypothetical protein